MEKEKLCLRCMRKIGDNNVCPYCKNEKTQSQEAPFLPLKTVVGNKYLVGKLVSHTNKRAVYYAFDLEAKKAVTLYEYYNKDILTRGADNYCLVNIGKASEFIDEKTAFSEKWNIIRSLSEFGAIPNIYNCFEDLGTAYAVGEYLGEMKPLREYLLDTEQGYLSWEEARALLMPVLSALWSSHTKGLLHLSISAETVLVDENHKAHLIPEYFCLKNKMTGEDRDLFEGYAAIEQYKDSSEADTYTDVYSFAAVLYRCLIGTTPDTATERYANDRLMIPARFAEKMPAYVINGLINALQVLPGDRTATAEILRDELSASPAAVNADDFYKKPSVPPVQRNSMKIPAEEITEDENADEEPDNAKMKKSTIAAFVISAVLCVAILLTVVFILKKPQESDENKNTTTEEVTEIPTEKISDTQETEAKSLTVPSFKGKNIDEIQKNEEYTGVFSFEIERIDSVEKKDTVISQSIIEGTIVNSLNGKKTVKLVVSNGYEVPEVVGMNISEARKTLEKAGFTHINAKMERVATNSSESYTVYRIVYTDSETGDWAPIPNTDRRISADDEIILSYCGEYSEPEDVGENEDTEEEEAEEELFEDFGDISEEIEDN